MVLDGGNNQFDNIEQSQEVSGEVLSDSQRLNNINEKFGDLSQNFDVFENFINNLQNTELKEKILNLFETTNEGMLILLEFYIEDNGFPTDITKDIFINEFPVLLLEEKNKELTKKVEETEQEVEETEQEVEETEEKQKKMEGVVDSIRKFEKNGPIELKKILSLYDGLRPDTKGYEVRLDELIGYLSNDILEKISDYILSQPGVNLDSKEYINFRRAVIDLKPDSVKFFKDFENQYHIEHPSVFDKSLKHSFDGDYVKKGNFYSKDMGDYSSFVNFNEYPPKRSIGVEGSDYRFSETLPVLNFKEPIAKFERAKIKFEKAKIELNKKRETLQAKGLEINSDLERNKQRLEGLLGIDTPEAEIEREFLESQINELEVKLEELKKEYELVKEEYKKIVEEFNLATSVYKKELAENEELYRKNIEAKDKEKKEILDFLHRSGFDLFPQELTNQILRELKQNILHIPGFNIDYGNINLENGQFGQGPTEMNSTKWKENLIKFMNKLIYGEFEPKEGSIFNTGTLISGFSSGQVDKTVFNGLLIDKGILSGTGFNIDQVRKNLEIEKKEGVK